MCKLLPFSNFRPTRTHDDDASSHPPTVVSRKDVQPVLVHHPRVGMAGRGRRARQGHHGAPLPVVDPIRHEVVDAAFFVCWRLCGWCMYIIYLCVCKVYIYTHWIKPSNHQRTCSRRSRQRHRGSGGAQRRCGGRGARAAGATPGRGGGGCGGGVWVLFVMGGTGVGKTCGITSHVHIHTHNHTLIRTSTCAKGSRRRRGRSRGGSRRSLRACFHAMFIVL